METTRAQATGQVSTILCHHRSLQVNMKPFHTLPVGAKTNWQLPYCEEKHHGVFCGINEKTTLLLVVCFCILASKASAHPAYYVNILVFLEATVVGSLIFFVHTYTGRNSSFTFVKFAFVGMLRTPTQSKCIFLRKRFSQTTTS